MAYHGVAPECRGNCANVYSQTEYFYRKEDISICEKAMSLLGTLSLSENDEEFFIEKEGHSDPYIS